MPWGHLTYADDGRVTVRRGLLTASGPCGLFAPLGVVKTTVMSILVHKLPVFEMIP